MNHESPHSHNLSVDVAPPLGALVGSSVMAESSPKAESSVVAEGCEIVPHAGSDVIAWRSVPKRYKPVSTTCEGELCKPPMHVCDVFTAFCTLVLASAGLESFLVKLNGYLEFSSSFEQTLVVVRATYLIGLVPFTTQSSARHRSHN